MSLDLAIFRGQKPNTKLRYTPGLALEGSGKLVTKFASVFFSDYNEVRDTGTNFMGHFRRGELTTNAVILSRFAIAAAQTVRQLGDQSALPADEQLVRAKLEQFIRVSVDSVYLQVKLVTPEGETRFVAPVETINE